MKRTDYYSPSLSGSWLIALLIIFGSLFFGLILGIIQKFSASPFWTSQSLAYILAMVLPFLFIRIISGNRRKEAAILGTSPVKVNAPDFGGKSPVWIFLMSALALLAMSVVIDPLSAIIPMPQMFKNLFEAAFVNSNIYDMILATCIMAPLCEEFLCRGMILRGIRQNRSAASAIVWAAFIFAIIHMNPWQAIPAFAMGLLFGWVYYRSGCIWLPIMMHCLNNSMSTVISRTMPDMPIDACLMDIMSTGGYIILYVMSASVLVGAILFLNKYLPEKSK